jgi:hypothetical protein
MDAVELLFFQRVIDINAAVNNRRIPLSMMALNGLSKWPYYFAKSVGMN